MISINSIINYCYQNSFSCVCWPDRSDVESRILWSCLEKEKNHTFEKKCSWFWAVQFQSLFTLLEQVLLTFVYNKEGPRAKRAYKVTILLEIDSCSKITKFSHAPVISIHFVSFLSLNRFGLFLCTPSGEWKVSLSQETCKLKVLLKEMRGVLSFLRSKYLFAQLVISPSSVLGTPRSIPWCNLESLSRLLSLNM